MPNSDAYNMAKLEAKVASLEDIIEEMSDKLKAQGEFIDTLRREKAWYGGMLIACMGIGGFIFTGWDKVKSFAAWLGKQ